jgi:hypothetical protein
MKYIKTCISLLIFFSCSIKNDNQKRITKDSFSEVIKLKGDKKEFVELVNPKKIHLSKDFLVVSTDGNDTLLHFISEDKLEYLFSKGIRGDGPGEINSIVWDIFPSLKDNSFWVYDLNMKKIHEFDLTDSTFKAIQSINQKGDWFYGFSNHWLDPNKIVSYTSMTDHKYMVFDTLGNKVNALRPWNEDKPIDREESYMLSGLYQGPIDFNPHSGILGHASIKFESFELLDVENNNWINVYGPSDVELEYDIFETNSGKSANVKSHVPRGYNDIFVGKETVFLVYIGRTDAEIKDVGYRSNTILQFDLEGNPLSWFDLDFPIRSLTVNESERIFYCITEDREPGIVVYKY